MKTAISIPDDEFNRFEYVAQRHGLSRSAFYRAAGARYAEELEGTSDLTQIANQVLASHGPFEDGFVRESERLLLEGSDW